MSADDFDDLAAADAHAPDEATLRATLEAMSVSDAESTLAQLASALFPTGTGDATQVTWTDDAGGMSPRRMDEERRSPDDRLWTAELRFRTLVEQIPAVTFMAVLGEGGNEIYVSPHIERLLGFTQKEWLENPFLWYRHLHPDDRTLWIDEFAKGCRSGGPFRAECRFLARDGHTVWVRGEARLVKDEVGRPLFLQGVAFDITESKRAEAMLLRTAVQSTESRYRDLVEQQGAIFWEAEVGSPGFTFVSRGTERILGYPPQRWMADADSWLTCVHPDDREETARASARARTLRGGGDEFEFRAIAADGRVVWLHQKVYADRSPGGRLFGVLFDITDRKRAEEILRANAERLQTEAGIRRTLHRIGTALAKELDVERVVQLATDEATTLTSAQFGAFFYNAVNEQGEAYQLYTLSGVPREAFSRFPMPRNTAIFKPTFSGEGPVRLADVTRDPRYGRSAPYHGMPPGHLPVHSYLAVPVISPSGEVLGGMFFGHERPGVFTEDHEQLAVGIAGWTAVAIDNAHLFRTAERARAAAEAANRAKDEFLATMSHELRTPLNAVLGWALILQTGDESPEVRRRALRTIERNARAQAQIIEDLLDVSRAVTGKLRLEPANVDLIGVIDAALDTVRLAADTKQIEIRRRVDPAASVVIGDRNRLQQAVANLLTNAVKFTPARGSIEVRLERAHGMARIGVEDDGQGIDPEFLPHVFERFRQADGSSTRAHGGLGLGLAIARHLVELHGGTIRADSPGPGRGATFTIEIPLLRDAPAPDAAGEQARALEPQEARPLAGRHVLVVDDEPDSCDLMALILVQAGAAVTTAQSAAEALEIVGLRCPDVLVSDIGLPRENGYELVRRIRALDGATATVPALAVTAYARDVDRERALAAGYQGHLAKPIVPRDLVTAIAALVASGR